MSEHLEISDRSKYLILHYIELSLAKGLRHFGILVRCTY